MRQMSSWFGVLCAACIGITDAYAAGPTFNENGARVLGRAGAFVAKADDPLAIHFNPGALARLKGHHLFVGANLSSLYARYTRAGIDDFLKTEANPDAPYATATVKDNSSPYVAPSLAWAYGGDGWGAGFGVYGPGAHGLRDFPSEGANRFLLDDAELLVAFVTGSFAYEFSDAFSMGVSLQWVMAPLNDFSLTLDSSLTAQEEDGGFLAQAKVDTEDFMGFSAIVGFHLRPSDAIEIGISSRVTPVPITASGSQTLSYPNNDKLQAKATAGELGFVDSAGNPQDGVTFSYTLAPWVKAGVRYIGRDAAGDESWDLELDLVGEFWSVYEDYVLEAAGSLNFMGNVTTVDPIVLPKHYNDTFAVRLGSDINLADWFTLRLGSFFETATVPLEYSNLDFFGFERVGASLGYSIYVGPVEIAAAYQFVWQPARTVPVGGGSVYMLRPVGDPPAPSDWDEETQGAYPGIEVNAGTYVANHHTVSLGVYARF